MSTTPVVAKKETFLDRIGHAFKSVFSFLGSPQGQAIIVAGETAATVAGGIAAPAALPAIQGVEGLINAGLRSALATESLAAAAGTQQGTGPQKLAAVTSTIAPNVQSFLAAIGVKEATSEQTQAIATVVANSLVAILNALPPGSISVQPTQG